MQVWGAGYVTHREAIPLWAYIWVYHAPLYPTTLSHKAPELLQDGRLTKSADVYSFGLLGTCASKGVYGVFYIPAIN